MADKKHFFISRAGEDAEFAKWVADTLEEAGYTTILQDHDIQAGDNFVQKMNEALEAAEQVIALLSPNYVSKYWTLMELWAAVGERNLIPVRIAECTIPPLIRNLVHIDLPGRDRDKLLKEIRQSDKRKGFLQMRLISLLGGCLGTQRS